MKRGCFKLFLLLLFVIKACLITRIIAENEEDTWMNPDVWARDHLIPGSLRATDKCCKCSEGLLIDHSDHTAPLQKQRQTNVDDAASLIYFKKFITMLFNRRICHYDSNQQLYERSIIFTIQSSQMDKLEQSQDPRDLDSILEQIFNNIRIPNMYYDGQQHLYTTSTGIKTIVINLLYDVWQLTKTSEMRFLLAVVIVILIAWIFKNRFNIGWLPLGFCSIFVYGYLYTYLECNRELELNQMLEMLNRDSVSEKTATGFKFLNFFKGIFYSDDVQDLNRQKLKQSAKISLGFCRPDHVLLKYFNYIFIKYLEGLIEQCSITLTTLNGTLSFPYNILSGCVLVSMICYITKLTFKYIFSPSAWGQYMHYKHLHRSEQPAITTNSTINSQGDRISGDNLKLLLNAFNAVPQRVAVASKLPNALSSSAAEDILEEPAEKNSVKILPKDENEKSNEKSSTEDADVKIDDLLEVS